MRAMCLPRWLTGQVRLRQRGACLQRGDSMPQPTRILLTGASGRMGGEVRTAIARHPGAVLAGALAREARDGEGISAWSTLDDAPDFDVLLDFSRPQALAACIALCEARGRALVTGTTGLGTDEHALLERAAARIPVLAASNFSMGVAVLEALVERAAAALPGWDCDIIELHHRGKQDAPSGTALALGARAQAGHAGTSPRYASLRCGDVVGEHTVQFTGQGERIELVHRASDRAIFARGAVEAACRLAGQGPARYRLADLFPA